MSVRSCSICSTRCIPVEVIEVNLSPLGLVVIQTFEEYASKAYRRFSHEPWTCGWGHTGADVTEGTTCTPEQARLWLLADTSRACREVDLAGFELTQHQFDALTSLSYNIGDGNFSRAHELHSLIAAKHWVAAGDHILTFDKVNGVEVSGLLRRRTLEKALFLDGVTA